MYLGVLVAGASVLLVIASAYGAHHAFTISTAPVYVSPFQSGGLPAEHALSRYHVRWYLATLLFLAFDVEMLFMYPWAVVVAEVGATAIVEMFLFLSALFIAVVWAWREGALRWV